jgi:hypothetical protein
MKKIAILTGIVLLIINTLVFIILNDYKLHNMLFANVSIILTSLLLFFLIKFKNADGFKIGLTFVFVITGVIRFSCAILSNNEIQNNFSLLIFVLIIGLEIILMFLTNLLNNK